MEKTAQSSNWFQITIVVVLLLILGNIGFIDWKLFKENRAPVDSGSKPGMTSVTGSDPVNAVSTNPTQTITQQVDTCGASCLQAIDQKLARAIATISAQTKTVTVTQNTTQKNGTTYIPLDGSSSTLSTDWVDVTASDVYIKGEDYGSNPYISFEASLKAGHEGGKAFVRLLDETNGIAVDGSELSSSATSYSQVSTGNLPFWRGNNLYRVQIKSLDNQMVYFTSGRVKIVAR